MEAKELAKKLQIVMDAITRTGDCALYPNPMNSNELDKKTKEEQEAMLFLQENYSDLYNSFLGNLLITSSQGGQLEIKINDKGGIDLYSGVMKITKESFFPKKEKKHEKIFEELEQ